MKNNFSNFIKIISIIVFIGLFTYVVFLIITKNTPVNVNKNETNSQIDTNIKLISEELVTILSYLNHTKETNILACQVLGKDIGFIPKENQNFFDYYAPIIEDCINNKNYIMVRSNTKEYKIITEEEINKIKEKYEITKNFISLKNYLTIDELSTYSEKEINELQNYVNNNYYLAYEIKLSNENKTMYKLNRIFKDKESYKAVIEANYNNHTYKAILEIVVENDIIKYKELIFY